MLAYKTSIDRLVRAAMDSVVQALARDQNNLISNQSRSKDQAELGQRPRSLPSQNLKPA